MKFRENALLIDQALKWTLLFCVLVTVCTTATVIFMLAKESASFFSQVSIFEFLFGTKWEPLIEPKSFGVLPLIFGTFMIVIGAILIALPMGLLTATYLNEFASEKTRMIIKPALEVLAGIPTVVYGYFALTFITPIIQQILPGTEIFNAASAAIVVGIMILPMVASLTDDAFRSVSTALREAAYGLGGRPFEVTTQVIMPAASSRIGAAIILAVSRAIGETMAVTLAAGADPKLTLNPLESIQTMTAYIVQVSLGDTPAGGIEYLSCFAVGALLFLITFLMNLIGTRVIFKTEMKYAG